ncbi:N-acetylmuramoyl-L-alanine amidase [uncultured Shimia sp.]|uniref:N-acetylmuramoyl-L-alanine amidase n=1 Tax=uncultured Shimia sp. TaxID=573152 RepID=UPI002612E629|nr:N-acetylmuramoyl-L-alanine amidase [uncultured Shimia sp.]
MPELPEVLHAPSPSFGGRRRDVLPDLIVLHYTAMQTAEAALERLCDADVEVSAHYLIAEDGRLWRMVDEKMRAWHAGAGQWRGIDDVNSRSIGIELANTGDHPFPEPQMTVLEALIGSIMRRWEIPPQNVIAHSDMAPARKCDPGRRFDWRRLALQNLSVWPGETQPSGGLKDLDEALKAIGYPMGQDGSEPCLRAFRERFRPWARGPADQVDAALAHDLATRFGVDPVMPSA